MKAVSALWYPPNTGATNSSGFSGLPGGRRFKDIPLFFGIGIYGYWWSSSDDVSSLSYGEFTLSYNHAIIIGTFHTKENGYGFSVRCIRD
jgi:uncharacterized protein (TIGR02145 family)